MAAKLTHRIMQRFWLDKYKPDENALLNWLDELKAKRQFTSTIRDSLRLIMALRRGDYSVLKELFPQAAGDLAKEYYGEALSLAKAVVENQQTATRTLSSGVASSGGLRPMSGPSIVSAGENSDIVMKKSSNNNAGANFLASLGALQ